MLTKSVSFMRPVAALFLFVVTGCGGTTPLSPTAPTAPTFELRGRAFDASAGISLAGVMLSAVDGPNAGKQATTGGDGRYALGDLLGGSFTLRAQRTGYLEFTQTITITSHTTIDVRLIPTRSLNSGWTGGQFLVTFDGQRISTRITSAQVTQNGTTVSGQFRGADGSSGTFTGRTHETQFVGSMGIEIVSGSRRCRGTAGTVTGRATGDDVTLAAATVPLETCGGAATDLELTLTP
jgi:hypothetical protein